MTDYMEKDVCSEAETLNVSRIGTFFLLDSENVLRYFQMLTI